MAKQYYPPETVHYGNAIIRVHIPILTEEEKVKQQENICDAFTTFLKKAERGRKKNAN